MVTVQIPAPPPGLVSNLLGLIGLAGIVFAIGALTNWRWAVLAGSILLVAAAYVAHINAQPVGDEAELPNNVRQHKRSRATVPA